jgi:hypothetical protein
MNEKILSIALSENNIDSPYWVMGSFDIDSLVINVNDIPENEKQLIDEFYVLFDGRLGNYIKNHPFDYNYIDLTLIRPNGPSVVETESFDYSELDETVRLKIIQLYDVLNKYIVKN